MMLGVAPPSAIHGTHLAEVLSMKINKINDGSEKCELCGTIQVEDEEGTLFMYNRCPENPECVYQNGCLSLIRVRERPINACRSFSVLLDLKDHSGNEFINNSFFVDLMFFDDTPFNEKWRDFNVEGKMGIATINLAVFQASVIVFFEVAFIKENDSSIRNGDHHHVYGSIAVGYGKRLGGEEKDSRFVIFEKTTENGVKLMKEDKYKIPLSRYFVVVPAYASLIVEGNIHCCHSNNRTKIIRISERITTCYMDLVTKEIKGEYGHIKLQVFWNNSFNFWSYREYGMH